MFSQWGFWVLWFLHGMSNFGCFRGSWFSALAAHPAVIGLTLSLKLSTCSKNSPKADQNSLLSQFTSNSVPASHLLLRIQVVVLSYGACRKVWIVVTSQGIPHGWLVWTQQSSVEAPQRLSLLWLQNLLFQSPDGACGRYHWLWHLLQSHSREGREQDNWIWPLGHQLGRSLKSLVPVSAEQTVPPQLSSSITSSPPPSSVLNIHLWCRG